LASSSFFTHLGDAFSRQELARFRFVALEMAVAQISNPKMSRTSRLFSLNISTALAGMGHLPIHFSRPDPVEVSPVRASRTSV
jgi:hypothetical protein